MHFKFKNTVVKQQSSTTALMDRTGVWSGSTVDWSDEAAAQGITIQEYSALKRKHGTSNVNLTRAGMVKAEMVKGTKQVYIIRKLGAMGRGYGERMIKADHAALSSAIKKARQKVQ